MSDVLLFQQISLLIHLLYKKHHPKMLFIKRTDTSWFFTLFVELCRHKLMITIFFIYLLSYPLSSFSLVFSLARYKKSDLFFQIKIYLYKFLWLHTSFFNVHNNYYHFVILFFPRFFLYKNKRSAFILPVLYCSFTNAYTLIFTKRFVYFLWNHL